MKLHEFLKLVESMMDAQQNYYVSRKTLPKTAQIELLVKSKQLEKQVRQVLKDGLEPTAYITPPPADAQLTLNTKDGQLVYGLDLFDNPLPTDGQGDNHETTTND